MFCGKCGTNNPESATFCKGCGAPLNPSAKPAGKSASGGVAVKSALAPEKKNMLIGIAAVGVVALVVIFALISVLGGGGGGGSKKPEDIAVKYANALMKGDAEAILKLFPKNEQKYYENENLTSKAILNITRDIEDAQDRANYRMDTEDWKYSCKVAKVGKGYNLKYVQSDYVLLDVVVTATSNVVVDITFTTSGKASKTAELKVPLVEVDGRWYLDAIDSDGYLSFK